MNIKFILQLFWHRCIGTESSPQVGVNCNTSITPQLWISGHWYYKMNLLKNSMNLLAYKIPTIWLMTCSSPRRTFFLHALSFEFTSKLCITLLNQFYFIFILKYGIHNLVIELCRAPFVFKCIAQLFIKLTHSFLAIELLICCKNA